MEQQGLEKIRALLGGAPAVTVYGASSSAIDKVFFDDARALGAALAARGAAVIDGGGAAGLMGAVNDGALGAGGKAIGVIPRFMADRGWGHTGLSLTVVTDGMHPRKALMAAAAKAVIAMPGGIGTLDELMEIMTWRQLGLFSGSVILLNTAGYYTPLINLLERAAALGFMRKGTGPEQLYGVAETPQQAVEMALG